MNTLSKQDRRRTSLQLIENEGGLKPKDYLLHPLVDALMMGGLGILFFMGMHFFVEGTADTGKIGWVMFYLGLAINFPHFMSTYVLLYKDYRKDIFTNWKFTWAAVVAPLVLVSSMVGLAVYSMSENSNLYMGYLPNLMFFLVGHHYVKQIYGCVMVCSAKKKFYFNKLESRALWLSMYSLWALSFFAFNTYTVNTHNFYGINYTTLGLDVAWLDTSYAMAGLSATFFLATMLKRYVQDGKVLPMSAWMAILSIYAWYIPSFHHPHYFLMIPFFHSLQYLLFSATFAKNKADQESKEHKEEPKQRMEFLKKMGTFILVTVMSGYLAWHFIPNYLDTHATANPVLGPTIFMFAFQIFLNIHHYLIDNVIWRKENQQMKKYL